MNLFKRKKKAGNCCTVNFEEVKPTEKADKMKDCCEIEFEAIESEEKDSEEKNSCCG